MRGSTQGDDDRILHYAHYVCSSGVDAADRPSGIFYPITALPIWLQWIGQTFPFYWLGLGLGARSAMLPADMAAAEIGASWRTLEMFAVLGAWAVIGMVLAPILLRRMARRQSGSAVAAVRQRVMAKGY